MAKKIVKVVKVQAKGGQANPAPPLGPVLGQAGINIQDFCAKFNEKPGRYSQKSINDIRDIPLPTS